jgi:hypothetical protein
MHVTLLQVAEAMVQAMAMEDDERAKRHSNMSRYAGHLHTQLVLYRSTMRHCREAVHDPLPMSLNAVVLVYTRNLCTT